MVNIKEAEIMQQLYHRIYNDPEFQQLEKKRGIFSWTLTILVFLIYYSFILIIAFYPEVFAKTISANSVISWGIPIGLFVIISSFLLTGIYVYRANKEFDAASKKIISQHLDDERSK